MPAAGGELAARVGLEAVRAGLGDADRVLEPLAGLEVVDDGAGGVAGGSDDVDVGIGAVEAALVTGCEVVPRDAFPAVVKVLRLDEPGNGEWDSLVRGASGSRWRRRGRGGNVRDSHGHGGGGGGVAGRVVGPGAQAVRAVAHRRGVPGEREDGRGQHGEDLAVLQIIDAGDADVVCGGGGNRHHS